MKEQIAMRKAKPQWTEIAEFNDLVTDLIARYPPASKLWGSIEGARFYP